MLSVLIDLSIDSRELMPTYDYKCNDCKEQFVAIHSIKVKSADCSFCSSSNTQKTISSFMAKTENTIEHKLRQMEEQAFKDTVRYIKDDNFAANISGADDLGHEERLQKVLKEQKEKNDRSRENIKRVEQ